MASDTGNTSDQMMKAIMSDEDVEGQTSIILSPSTQGWLRDKVYTWNVTHRPSINSLSITIEEDSIPLWSHEWEHTFLDEAVLGYSRFLKQ